MYKKAKEGCIMQQLSIKKFQESFLSHHKFSYFKHHQGIGFIKCNYDVKPHINLKITMIINFLYKRIILKQCLLSLTVPFPTKNFIQQFKIKLCHLLQVAKLQNLAIMP